MDKYELLQVGNRETFKIDISNGDASDILKVVEAFDQMVMGKELADMVFLTNVENVTFDKEAMKAFKTLVEKNKEIIAISVFCGISQMQKIMLTGIAQLSGREFMFFRTEQEAMNYIENVL